MFAIDENQGSASSPSFFDSAITAVENAGTSVVNGVESAAVAGFHAAGSVVGGVAGTIGKAESAILSPLVGPLKYLAIGLVAIGGIYLLLEYRQVHGKAF